MNWAEVEIEIQKLAKVINFSPTVIIGIARGGLVPACLLSKHLRVPRLHSLTVRKDGERSKVVTRIDEDLTGERVLLVEDVLELGASLEAASEYLRKMRVELRTCCLYTLPNTKFKPDFSLGIRQAVVKFPWE